MYAVNTITHYLNQNRKKMKAYITPSILVTTIETETNILDSSFGFTKDGQGMPDIKNGGKNTDTTTSVDAKGFILNYSAWEDELDEI